MRPAGYDPPPDPAARAAALATGLPRTRPFVDGNKRTVAVAGETVIVLDGTALPADDPELYAATSGWPPA
ncbi:Fic family protein [Xanthomonas arboricola]|uniref:Fic family protein n=1 Tax=Xanthomonas arboricola TaxID=56448 RepID=UPI003D18DF93